MKRHDPGKRLENEIQIDRSRGYEDYIKGVSYSLKECFNRPAYPNMEIYRLALTNLCKGVLL